MTIISINTEDTILIKADLTNNNKLIASSSCSIRTRCRIWSRIRTCSWACRVLKTNKTDGNILS